MMTTGLRTLNRAEHGFTLVELLVVIAIIMLLVTLMVPSLNAFLDRGRGARTATTIRTLESGLELHRSEPALDSEYPPSEWGITDAGKRDGSVTLPAFGAEVLVWALAGPSLEGTAGTYPPPELWSTPPAQMPHRFGPFLDVSKAVIEIPLAYSVIDSDALPTFMDDFDMPILFFVANPTDPLRYRLADNALYFRPNVDRLYHADPPTATVGDTFYEYIRDGRSNTLSNNPNIYVPHNRDTFLLISAGPDRRYGTADDICNFPFTAQGE